MASGSSASIASVGAEELPAQAHVVHSLQAQPDSLRAGRVRTLAVHVAAQFGAQQTTAAEALWRLQSQEFRWFFDPLVLAQFLKWVPPFPVATTVQLSDDRRGVVIGLQPDKSWRPKIRTLGDEEVDIDLAEDENLTIETHLGRNVSAYYYEPPSVADLYTAEDALFAATSM